MKSLLVCLLISVTVAFAEDETEASGVDPTMRAEELQDIQMNYNQQLAVTSRRQHLFCLNRSTSLNEEGNAIVNISEFEQNGNYVWTLFVQMPVISYLDPSRKLSLMDVVLRVLDYNDMDLDDICIGTYETYELSYFRESVLFHVYGRSAPFPATTVSDQFNEQVVAAFRDGTNNYVVPYPGQNNVIALNLNASAYFVNLTQPRLESSDGVDPTTLAVLIGSYGFNVTFSQSETVDSSVSREIGDGDRRSFASNPNPINYGLEPGDIVFAVFGSILLAILGGLIVLGYCIHPFFLA